MKALFGYPADHIAQFPLPPKKAAVPAKLRVKEWEWILDSFERLPQICFEALSKFGDFEFSPIVAVPEAWVEREDHHRRVLQVACVGYREQGQVKAVIFWITETRSRNIAFKVSRISLGRPPSILPKDGKVVGVYERRRVKLAAVPKTNEIL